MATVDKTAADKQAAKDAEAQVAADQSEEASETAADEKTEKEAAKFCPCGKQAVDFGDGDGLKCPQHFTKGDDLVDSAPLTGEFTEADDGTNKGATELAVQEPAMSDAGKALAKEPTQKNTPPKPGSAAATAGNSEEATNAAGTTQKVLDDNAKDGGFKNAADANKQADEAKT